jgi:hypothetical protein
MRGSILLIFLLGCGSKSFRSLAVIPLPHKEFLKPYPIEIYVDEIERGRFYDSKIQIINVEGEFEEWSPITQENLLRSAIISGLLTSKFCKVSYDPLTSYHLSGKINKWKFYFKSDRITWEGKGYDYWIVYSYETDFYFRLEDNGEIIWEENFVFSDEGSWNVYFFGEIKESFEEVVSSILKETVESLIDSLDSLFASRI